MCRQREKRFSGFTLIELMVVIAVTAVLVVMAGPAFTNMLAQKRINKSVENIYSLLQFARNEVVSRNSNVLVDISPGTGWCAGFVQVDTTAGRTSCDCTVTDPDATNACIVAAGTVNLLRRVDNNGTTDIDVATDFTNDQTGFDAPRAVAAISGALADGTITVTSTTTGDVVSIDVSRLGRIRICSDSLGSYPSCS